jgi:hypothetical protein
LQKEYRYSFCGKCFSKNIFQKNIFLFGEYVTYRYICHYNKTKKRTPVLTLQGLSLAVAIFPHHPPHNPQRRLSLCGYPLTSFTILIKKKPEISVCLPMYNASRHLRECIDSILAQTFEDFELLIVDDGYNYAADLQRMGFIYVYNDCRIGAAVSSKTRPYQTTSTHHERKQLQPLPAR